VTAVTVVLFWYIAHGTPHWQHGLLAGPNNRYITYLVNPVLLCLCVYVSTSRAADGDADAADAADAAGDAAGGPWRLLGVDCEMCATSESDKELLQLAVVDEADNLVMQVGPEPSNLNLKPEPQP
jgi:hypothetical protein